jgi:hypothetical protein
VAGDLEMRKSCMGGNRGDAWSSEPRRRWRIGDGGAALLSGNGCDGCKVRAAEGGDGCKARAEQGARATAMSGGVRWCGGREAERRC